MAKEEEYFNPLDPLGPEFGKINQPIADTKGYTAFEGSRVMLPQPNMPVGNQIAYSNLPKLENLNAPNNQIYSNVVRTNVNNPSIPQKAFDINEYNDSLKGYLDNMFQSNQDSNDYARIYSYDAGSTNLNTFYKRYSAYGQEKFDEVGFSPLRDNDANFNARTTRWDDFNRMMSNSFVPLFTQGFTSGFKSFGKILRGDFTSSDREDAEVYEEAAAIGQSTKGGIGGFMNNAAMNFSYTAGIITEAIAEEVLGAILAAPTGGSSLFTTTVNNVRKLPSLLKGVKTGYQGVRQTLNLTKEISGARKVYNAIKESQFLRGTLNQLNPLNNTMGALKQIRQADNFTNLGKLYKTAGGLYRDARNINMALSEARLEGGMVQNKIYDELYREAYIANGNKVPSDKELAEISKEAEQGGYETLLENVGIIYATNAITFNNITGPKGGLRNFIKSTTDDIYEIASREGSKNFGKIGKVIYNRTAKAFELEKNNLKNWARGWLKNPIHKSVGKTVSYFKANFSEGIQENLQETIAQANEKYFMDSYNSPTLKSMLYSRAAMRGINKGKLDYFSDAWAQQNPFTAQGFETFASGFVMGTMAGPLNSAVPFLSRTYNRMFNKEEYTRWKEAQTTVAQNLVNELNNTNLQTFLSNHTQNLGVQERVAATKQRGTKKEALDAETEAYISQVGLLKRTGTFGIFSEKLKDLHNLTDDEFAEAVGVEKDQVDKYRARVDSSVQRLNKIKDLYERVERKNPNPINISEVKEDDPEYQEKVILYHAWETANRNIVFFNGTYDNILERRAEITKKYNNNKKLKSISNRKRNLLFNPIRPFNETREAYNGVGVPTGDMLEEINLLEKELALEKENTKNPGKIQMLQEQIDLTRDYAEQFRALDIFQRREEYVGLIKEKLKAETGTEYTDEQVLKFMEDEFGAVNDTQKRDELLKNLRNSYTNYLKANAKQNGEEIFNEDIDETWELMKDYYDLDIEKTKISKYVDVLNDPMAFLEAVRRNNDWLKKVTAKKIDYYEKIIREEMDNIRANALLNSLANKGLYINTEDMLNYFADGVPPTEIYDDINKKIYPIGSKEYAQIYQDYFKKYEELKEDLNPNKSEIIDEAYQQQINALEKEKQEKIDALPKEDVETQINKLEGKISLKSLSQEIQNDQYAELKVYQEKDSTNDRDEIETVTVYKDKVGQLRLENEEGDILDSEDATQKYSSARIYSIDKVSDPVEVEKITNFYNEKIEEVKEAYVASKENMELEIPYEDVTPESNLDTPDLAEFKEELYSNYQKEYVNKLSPSEKNALLEDEDLNKKTFEEWYSKPENKKYFDEYNNANRPVLSKQETTMNIRGVEVNTNTKTLEQLIAYRDDINNQITSNNEEINRLNPETEKEQIKQHEEKNKELSLNVKNLNNIISARQFANFPEEIKSAVRSIQKIFKAQSKVEKGVELTEDDEVTGLKKGQKAYRINGKFHRRTTQAIQDVIDETYKYTGQENLEAIFKQTIAKKGLNPASIKEFVDMLRSLPDTGEAALPGTNDIFFNKLEEELSALPNMTAEQIELERQKDEILTKANKEKNLAKQEALFNQAEEIQNNIDGITPATTTPVSKTINFSIRVSGVDAGNDVEINVLNSNGDITRVFIVYKKGNIVIFEPIKGSVVKILDLSETEKENLLKEIISPETLDLIYQHRESPYNKDIRKSLETALNKDVSALEGTAPVSDKKADIIQTNKPNIQTVGNVTFGTANKQGQIDNNEDAVYVDTQNGVFILADGMGGEGMITLSPAQASKLVINKLLGNSEKNINELLYEEYLKNPDITNDEVLEILQKNGINLTGTSRTIPSKIVNAFRTSEDISVKKGFRSGATALKAVKTGKNTYTIEKVGDTVFFVVDKNGKVTQQHGLSDVATTQGYMFSIKDGKPFNSTPRTDNFTITLNEGETLVLATDFIETDKAIQDFIDSNFGKNLDFEKFQKNNKVDDSTFITIKYDAEVAALEAEAKETTAGSVGVGGDVKLEKGNKIQWNVYGNEESGEWTVGEKTKTRGGKDAVVLTKVYVEASSDGKSYTKEYADANGIKYDNERTIEHIVPLEDLQSLKETTKAGSGGVGGDVESKKADAERRQRVADIITSQLKLGVELPKILETLAEQGYVEKINNSAFFKQSVGRDAVVFNIDGAIVPVYRSSEGTSSKTKGEWYPFFFNGGDWLVKAGADTYKDGYNNPIIKQILDSLNKNYKYDKPLAQVEGNNEELLALLPLGGLDLDVSFEDNSGIYDFQNYIAIAVILKDWQSKLGNIDVSGYQDYLDGASSSLIKTNPTLKSEIEKAFKIPSDIFAELDALEGTAQPTTKDNFDTATKKNTTKNIIDTFFAENSYEDGRIAGNFFDLAKDYLETGKKPEFDEKIITREAYDSLIEYLDTIKKRVDSGELYIVGRDLIVYDSDIVHSDGRKDRIAGEIDLILVDKDGIYVVDIKSGQSDKFLNFNNLSTTNKKFTKRNEYTLQTAAYATMLERMIDRKVAGIAMLPIQRESNKKTNQVIEAGKPLAGQFFNELEYKVDEDGKIVLNKKIDPKTQKPFNEKQFTITGNKYKFDFLVPLYRESVQEEMDKLFPKKLGELEPGSKRAIANRINNIRQRLSEITDELSDTNVKNLAIIKVLIDNAVKQNISIPKDIIEQYESKNKNLKQYTSKEKIKSIIDKYKKNLNSSESNLKKQADELRKIKSNVSFDNIDKSIFNEESDFIKEQLESDSNFKYYFDQHNSFYKNAVNRSPTDNQIVAVETMKESGLLTDTDISDADIKYLSMAEASELIHEGVKRIQYLKTSGVEKSKEFREYQKNIFALMTATKINSNDVSLVQLFEDAEKLSKTERTNQAIDLLDIKLNNLNSEYNKEFTSDVRKNRILKEILDIEQFKEALIDTYEMPIDIIEQVEAAETIEEIEDDFDTSIKVGDIVYSRKKNNNTAYTVKEKTKDSYILSPPRGKAITVKIDNFADNYITKVEMDSGNITPPTVEVTDTEKERLNESQVTVNDFLKNQDSKTEAYKKGINSTPEENRKNLLNKTKDCP